MSLISVAEAQARMLALSPPLPIETVPVLAAVGRYAATSLVAKRTQPAVDLSAMDGYAIRFGERPGPWQVVRESTAGGQPGSTLAPGEAARIFTGAPVPAGADCILIQEEASRNSDTVTMTGEGPPAIGAHIRRAGNDFTAGAVLLPAGVKLGAAAIALAVSGGHAGVSVRRKPRVAILSTGNELVLPGEPTPGAMLPASNGPMLAALLANEAVDMCDHGIVRDDLDVIAGAFARLKDGADIIVTTGGASVGDHDLVLPALHKAGAQIDFWRVAMKPGKPIMIGTLGNAIVIGLPGNPVSAFVTAILFLRPLIAHLLGAADPVPSPIAARLGGPIRATGKRAEYLRGCWADGSIYPVGSQDSASLSALSQAEVLIVRGIDAPARAAGAQVGVIPIA
jgi:molybdopterin molybdotransferase